MATKMYPLGAARAGYAWTASGREVDMTMPLAKPVPLRIAAAPQNVTIDLKRSAMVVIDMQNDFCTEGGWVDSSRRRLHARPQAHQAACRSCCRPLREAGVPVIWVNWGYRPDLANMPPNQMHLYKPTGEASGWAIRCPARARRCCRRIAGRRRSSTSSRRSPRTSRSTSTASAASGTRRSTASCAISASRTVLFAGVNTDQCVHALADRRQLPGLWLRHGRGLLRHHVARLLHRATVCNVKKCFGFVTDSGKILKALKK